MEYRRNPIVNRLPEIDILSDFTPPLSLEMQFKLINALPNFHKYPWFKMVKHLKHEQRMPTSTRMYPGSPRNRILQAASYRPNPSPIIRDVLMHLVGCKIPVRYPDKGNKGKRKRSVRIYNKEEIGYSN